MKVNESERIPKNIQKQKQIQIQIQILIHQQIIRMQTLAK